MDYFDRLDADQKQVVLHNEGPIAVVSGAGCLIGTTKIRFNRAKKGFETTLEKAFKSFNNIAYRGSKGWDKAITTYVRAYTGEGIFLHPINDIVYSGKKEVFKLTLSSRQSIEATADHKILTDNGFIELRNLVIGKSKVMTDTLLPEKTSVKGKRRDKTIRHLKYFLGGAKDKNDTRRESEYKLVATATLNNMTLDELIHILRNDPLKSKMIKIIPKGYEVHHKNGNHEDNSPENLEIMTCKDHRAIHKEERYSKFNQGIPKFVKVTSIKRIGVKKTYDICCEAPHHNFVANGIVVHNSGKTTTLVAKIIYLIEKEKIRPTRIVACTLTKKAAVEIQHRLSGLIGEEKAEKVRISTIHSLAYKTFKAAKQFHSPSFKPAKIMINQYECFLPLLNRAKASNLGNKQVKDHLVVIQHMKMNMKTIKDYKAEIKLDEKLADVNGDLSRLSFEYCVYYTWQDYNKYLEKHNKMDFTDILVNCYKTISNPKYEDFLKDYSRKIEYLIVDEAQDTTALSFKIIDELRKFDKNVCLVGDLRQTIFSFAGAYIQNIPEFIKRFDAKIIDLKTNYRSTKTIVDNANHFISTAKVVMGKPSVTPNPQGGRIIYRTDQDDTQEADWVSDRIQYLLESGEHPNEIAVIYRVNSQSRAIEDSLIMNNVPYYSYSDQPFYQRKETKDLLTYLRLFNKPSDIRPDDIKRIANRPLRYIKNDIIEDIENHAFEHDVDFIQAAKDFHYPSQFQETAIMGLIDNIQDGSKLLHGGNPPMEVIDYILKDIGYEKWANEEKKIDDAEVDVTMNLDAIMTSAERFETVPDFLAFIAKVIKADKEKKDESGDYVRLMTVHRAKGKEFKHVFIIGMCNRCYPFYKSRGDTYQEEEERRIMYVALTRPKTHLYLCALNGQLGSFKVIPSQYLYDMQIQYNGNTNEFTKEPLS